MISFGRVVCVSLERRPDRWEAFNSRVPGDFPWAKPERFNAIDGKKCKHPGWWRQGGGAWGCYKSHCNILEQALQDGVGSVLVFEDDATFIDGFSDKAAEFFANIPGDWEQAYLGGQHLRRPQDIDQHWVRCININRTHAFAVRGDGIWKLYKWLHNTKDWHNRHHVDHHLGRIHASRGVNVYAPVEWLCGQAEDTRSDVCGKPVSERWWMMRKPTEKPKQRPFVAVIGLHRSGSSATAMILHKLGVSMGDKLGGYEGNHGGGGEAAGLGNICERAARFPSTAIKSPERIKKRLREWIAGRWRRGPHMVGGKYPHLCAMIPMLQSATNGRLRIIHCCRPLEDSIDSLKRRSRKCTGWLAASDEQCEAVQEWLWDEKSKHLGDVPKAQVLDVEFDRLMNETEAVVNEIIKFLDIEPTEEQYQAAIEHIRDDIKK